MPVRGISACSLTAFLKWQVRENFGSKIKVFRLIGCVGWCTFLVLVETCYRMLRTSPSSNSVTTQTTALANSRIASIDVLRGIAMILMPLDRTREFFTNYGSNPLYPQHTTVMLYLARWITRSGLFHWHVGSTPHHPGSVPSDTLGRRDGARLRIRRGTPKRQVHKDHVLLTLGSRHDLHFLPSALEQSIW